VHSFSNAASARSSARRALGTWLCALAAVVALACSGEEASSAPALAETPAEALPPEAAAGEVNAPPPDIKSTEQVRCLVDSPPGCEGCDKGDACVYEELSRYDCVYVVYGTDCSK
jgi:hypothetical protein